jgi:hypothetical protein
MQRIRRPTQEEADAMKDELVQRVRTDRRVLSIIPPSLYPRIPPKILVPILPLEILRALSPEYIQTLPESVQRKVQKLLNTKEPQARRATAGRASKEPENVGAPTTRRSRKKAA